MASGNCHEKEPDKRVDRTTPATWMRSGRVLRKGASSAMRKGKGGVVGQGSITSQIVGHGHRQAVLATTSERSEGSATTLNEPQENRLPRRNVATASRHGESPASQIRDPDQEDEAGSDGHVLGGRAELRHGTPKVEDPLDGLAADRSCRWAPARSSQDFGPSGSFLESQATVDGTWSKHGEPLWRIGVDGAAAIERWERENFLGIPGLSDTPFEWRRGS